MGQSILCIDTSADFCTVGIVTVPVVPTLETPISKVITSDMLTVLSELQTPMNRGHAEHIMPHIAQCLDRAEMTMPDISSVVVTVGAGAFTGIRIGLATAKGLCLPHKIPCIGVGVSHALSPYVGCKDALIILETKRTDYYVAPYIDGVVQRDMALEFDDVVDYISHYEKADGKILPVMGSGADRFVDTWREQMPTKTPPFVVPCPTTLSVIDMGISALKNPLSPVPIYVRAPHVQPPKSGLVPPNVHTPVVD